MKENRIKYELIAPRADYLTDIVVLAQAWKKTQKYIRRHNWYADVLELDCSTINIEDKILNWAALSKRKTYKPDKMRIVPAPKNSQWIFEDNVNEGQKNPWHPEREQRLRPLAHLSIKDQTLATAAMLCLADAVESEQGPSEEQDFRKAQKQRIYSYGNRLHCEWFEVTDQRKQAKFGWGNSHSYRKFYEDYRLFLSRPKKICQFFAPKLTSNQNMFVVSIDLKGFFDNIDHNALRNQIKIIYERYVNTYKLGSEYYADDKFWTILENIFKWKWEDLTLDDGMLEKNILPEGLPQGLVASGFLSNAYLIDFDNKIGEQINKEIQQKDDHVPRIILRDYCRYVDDLRIVVETYDTKDTNQELIAAKISDFISQNLKAYLDQIDSEVHLKINEKKTKVLPYRQMSTQSNISSLMSLFQGVLSGTPDIDSLQQMAGGLDGLLQTSEQLINELSEKTNWLDLSRISTPNIDVRDDTLKRFVATRIVSSLRLRRGMIDLHEPLGSKEELLDDVTSGQMLDHEFETTARKLIGFWANNPSLTLLLKCGLDLFPDKLLLNVVLEALECKLFPTNEQDEIDIREIKTCEYVVADLFRAGAVDIGFRPKIEYPESVDINSFRQELGSFAKHVLNNRPDSPWYVKQQAYLFLASIGDTMEANKDGKVETGLGDYQLLHQAILYRPIELKRVKVKDWFPIMLVAQQLHSDAKKFAQWFVSLISTLDDESEKKELIFMLITNRPDLLEEIRNSRKARKKEWLKYIPDELDINSKQRLILFNNEDISLLRIIQSDENHFTQENALLLLAYKILKYEGIEELLEKGLSVKSIFVNCSDWKRIQHLDYKNDSYFSIRIDFQSTDNKLYEQPSWINMNHPWLYGLGRILRSCLTGEFDFTTSNYLTREDVGQYKGLRSTWYTRRFGLVNSPSGLNSYQDPVSPWISELLIRLLQWPGITIQGDLVVNFDDTKTAVDLSKIITKRIHHQLVYFGKLTGTPVYEIPTISYQETDSKMFRVAIVQTLLPKIDDFNDKDPTHWTDSFRARHRAHIASVCNLVRLKLKTWSSAQQRTNTNTVDLIVFPELSIHPDDMWLLRRLSDATKASIFAGMTFILNHSKEKTINQAVWILRSERKTGREFVEVRQGKQHMTKDEKKLGIQGHRPYQVLVEFKKGTNDSIRVAGAICYDATDLALVADLRDVSDIFVVAALNKDVQTFDNMVGALHYHMYQPVILANTGEFGGSTAQAPFTKHDRLIAHVHGNNQVAISIFELDPTIFKSIKQPKAPVEVKASPAGYTGRF
ncbi:reverse transcriptase domain-containing protein [Paenibacillus macquariensis]|uniref:Predicted amidohydrolase n=1 Tax=Paenibacillus macquariensis TaxID=948756 RepID=A0ABY1KD00_9BACL|nr:reverse transcriptase domain-containing protein [Paenibacillus macquariensis]MEC0093209.1 reverse transcriptase domain-containing protein [Paenibacillus macquariensis]OAB35048.1 hypothetical protein PMSM_10700 [Paenibacillus macquariensis subsp. macquariensis]SIR62811.1 Predicted amidohydrolase [Paenibacillus macquariensis]